MVRYRVRRDAGGNAIEKRELRTYPEGEAAGLLPEMMQEVSDMFRSGMSTPLRAYQVQIRDDYLKDLYQYDAGSVEQEIFARAERGLVIVMTDRPAKIFHKFGQAVESVTYLGPMVDLPDQPIYANHSAVQRTRSVPAIVPDELAEGFRSRLGAAWTFAVRTGQLIAQPFFHAAGLVFRKLLPNRALRALHIDEVKYHT